MARSLREAFPDLHLVGVAYSARSTGLHHAVFDDVRVSMPGRRRDLTRRDVAAHPRAPRRRRVVDPGLGARGALAGPRRRRTRGRAGADVVRRSSASTQRRRICARRLGLLLPARDSRRARRTGGSTRSGVSTDGACGCWERAHAAVADRRVARAGARTRAARRWLVLVPGCACRRRSTARVESIAFAAYRGGHARRQVTCATAIATADGTSWGGGVADLVDVDRRRRAAGSSPSCPRRHGRAAARSTLVRSVDDELWLIEWRPRFADWIHGCTLTGANLPGALLGAATGRAPGPARRRGGRRSCGWSSRSPCGRDCPLPEPAAAAGGAVRAGAYLAGMPDPAQPRPMARGPHRREPAARPAGALQATVGESATPRQHAACASRRPGAALVAARAGGRARPRGAAGSRSRTASRPIHTAICSAPRAAHGFLAEAISAAELRRGPGRRLRRRRRSSSTDPRSAGRRRRALSARSRRSPTASTSSRRSPQLTRSAASCRRGTSGRGCDRPRSRRASA